MYILCINERQLGAALANVRAGATILLYPNRIFNGHFRIGQSGRPGAPIVIRTSTFRELFVGGVLVADVRGSFVAVFFRYIVGFLSGLLFAPFFWRYKRVLRDGARATLDGGIPDGEGENYTLHLTGNYIHVINLRVTGGNKGIMLDNANYNLIDGVEVSATGEEGVHFRDGSSDNTIRHSHIHDTGKLGGRSLGFGEGVYVGSDFCKWADREDFPEVIKRKEKEGSPCGEQRRFNKIADNNIIENVRIGPGVTAESVDIKEGTTGTIVRNCEFFGTGISGCNSADSFIDVKGNDSVVEGNIVLREDNTNIVDAFEVHDVIKNGGEWGVRNTFRDNTAYLDDESRGYVVNVSGPDIFRDSVQVHRAFVSNNVRFPPNPDRLYKGDYEANT